MIPIAMKTFEGYTVTKDALLEKMSSLFGVEITDTLKNTVSHALSTVSSI